MPIVSDQLGPGVLELGAGPLDVSIQVTSCRVSPAENVSTTEAVKVLSGDELAGSDSTSYTYTLDGTFLQDLLSTGVVAWSWDNAGTPQDFRFVPSTARGRQVTGQVRPVPLTIGGDEIEAGPMTADFTWRTVGTPVFGDVI